MEIKLGYKILCYLKEVDSILWGELQYPVTFEIDASNHCQNRCNFCMFADHMHKNRVHMSMLLYMKVLLGLKRMKVKSITFTGGGEPLMNPNIREMIELALEEGFKVGLVTNGILIRDIWDITENLEYIRVSIDAGTRETYKKIKGTDYFDQILLDVREICCDTVGISFVVTEENKHEIELFEDIRYICEVDYAQVKPELRGEDIEGQLNNLEKSNFFLTERYNIKEGDELACKIAGLVGIINATGKVYYCCIHRGKERFEIGDANQEKLEEIYNRRNMYSPDFSECLKWGSCRYLNYAKFYRLVEDRRYMPFRHRDFI